MGQLESDQVFPFPDRPTPPSTKDTSPVPPNTPNVESAPPKMSDDSDQRNPSKYSSHPFLNVGHSNGKTIICGGFARKEEALEYNDVKIRCFPPPPNAAYNLTSQAYAPHDSTSLEKINTSLAAATGSDNEADWCTYRLKRSMLVIRSERSELQALKNLDGTGNDRVTSLATISEHAATQLLLTASSRRNTVSKSTDILHQRKSRGEILADRIDFPQIEYRSWISRTPGVSGEMYSAKEQREDYVDFIDDRKPPLGYCKKCYKFHIPEGSSVTLEARDTCGSGLPDWFPTQDYENPWRQYKRMINDWVYLAEITQGYNHKSNPDAPVWNLQFHNDNKKWRSVGRRGGWWKCRDGSDGKYAPEVERECELCNNEAEKPTAQEAKKALSVAQRMRVIEDFIAFHMDRVAEEDKAIVLARAHAEGIPEYVGCRSLEEEQFCRDPVLSRNASTATLYNRAFSISTTNSNSVHASPYEEQSVASINSIA